MSASSDDIMELLLSNIKQPELDKNFKPTTIRCFGDVAMSLGYQLARYGMSVLEVLYETCVILSEPIIQIWTFKIKIMLTHYLPPHLIPMDLCF